MRQKLITLDPTSWDLAAKKSNFSQWVRDQLRSERNKSQPMMNPNWKECILQCGRRRLEHSRWCSFHHGGEEE